MSRTAILLIAVSSLSGCGPNSLRECLYERLETVQSDAAARIIAYECREEFSRVNKREVDISGPAAPAMPAAPAPAKPGSVLDEFEFADDPKRRKQ